MKTLSKPYAILWWSIPLWFFPLILLEDGAIDIQLHDTYIVLGSAHLAVTFAIVFGLLGGVYWLLRKHKLLSALSMAHSIMTSLAMIGLSIGAVVQSMQRTIELDFFSQLNSLVLVLILIFISVQLIFILNVVVGLIKGKN